MPTTTDDCRRRLERAERNLNASWWSAAAQKEVESARRALAAAQAREAQAGMQAELSEEGR